MTDFQLWPAIVIAALVSLPGWLAIYFIRRREDPTAYESMEDTILSLSNQVRDMHASMARLQNRIAELTVGVRVLVAQVTKLGHAPEYTMEPEPLESVTPTDATALYNRLIREFNVDEMNDLAFRLGVETGELGEETISGLARSLIRYMERRGDLPKLALLMSSVRPTRPHL